MGWFDEQIRQRAQNDDELFSDAMAGMVGVIMGEKIGRALRQQRIVAEDAIGEILKHYHVKSRELPAGIQDLDDQLEFQLRPSGIMRRTVKLTGNWYENAVGAMLGVLKDGETPVALIPGKFSGYQYYDASAGKTVRVNRRTAENLLDEAICFYKPLPLGKIGLKDLMTYVLQSITLQDILPVMLSTLVVTLVGLLLPKLHNIIYGYVIPGNEMGLFFAAFGFLICVSLSQLLLGTARTLTSDRIGQKMGVQAQAAAMMRVLSLPADFFRQYSSGDLCQRMNYINLIVSQLESLLFTTGLTSLFSLIYIGEMAKYGPGLVIPGMLVIIITVGFSVITSLYQIRISRKSMELSAKEAGMNYALINGIQKIKLSGAEKRAFSRWANLYQKSLKYTYDPPVLLKFGGLISSAISLAGTIVIYYYTISTGVALADYFAFNAAFGMVMGAFSALVGMAASFATIKPMMDMVEPILKAEPEIAEQKQVVTRLSGSIELNNISFRYNENMPWVLDDLSLKIRPGEYVAIVGGTGCGKSTLMRLLLGFEKPQKGGVYYDGKDMSTLDLKSLRRHMGTVLQDGKLFQGDIFSNITITAPNLTMDDAWEAARISGMDQDIAEMPMGMFTMVAEGSGGISGGQRQRLLIARAVAAKPKILLFDEATSALDNITQKKVSDALEKLKCTRIVVAHRLSTIRHCSRIIVLDKGKIIEDGTYDQLVEKKGFFAELVERQRLDTAD